MHGSDDSTFNEVTMDRKKVAVLLPWLKMGGTNKIALNFMRELSQYCDVTLILSENSGELLPELPENIRLIVDEMEDFRDLVKEDLRALRVGAVFRDALYYAKFRLGKDGVDNYKYIVDRHGFISEEEFDCAISYHGQSPERLLNLLYRIHAKKRVVWIHGEMSFPHKTIDELRKYYAGADHFFFVSAATRDAFTKLFPFAGERATVYHNPIDRQEIVEKAKAPLPKPFSDQYANLLTVGRQSKEKGQDMVPAVTRALLDRGLAVRWYLIGDGPSRKHVETLIREYKVEENVFLPGTQTNPYGYMRACDIYVQPSYTEGFSTTICEAGILGKAIGGTKPSGGIREQITDGEDGLIVDASVEGLTDGIARLIEDEALRHQFEDRIQNRDFEGKGEIEKFLRYLES